MQINLNTRDNMSVSLERGRKGELEFLALWQEKRSTVPIEKLPGTKADFLLPISGHTIELKTDDKESRNFFMERFRNIETNASGGPWQSKEKAVTMYAYRCRKENRIYYFRVDELCQRLDELALELPSCQVSSHSDSGNQWSNFGYIVHKTLLSDILWKSSGDCQNPFSRV